MTIEIEIAPTELVIMLKESSREGFNFLCKNYSNSLLCTIYRIVKNRAVSEDLLQECFIKIWKNIDSYDEVKGSLYTWMLNIARNMSIDYLRTTLFKNFSATYSYDTIITNTESHKTVDNTDTIGLKSMIDKLEKKYKDVICVTYMYGYSHRETAEILNIPEGTVKTRITRALRLLRVEHTH